MMQVDPEAQLAEDMGKFYDDPLGFVLYAFDWDTDPSLQLVKLPEPWASKYNLKYGPDQWACELLEQIGDEVKKRGFDGKTAVDPLRVAVRSGHGIGKSAMTAWLILWIMSTRPFCQGTVTATTAPQLQNKTWARVADWRKRCITGHWFEISTGRGNMKLWHKEHKDTWFCSGQTCKEENSESFAGQHAANSTSFYLFDESSGVPNKIPEVAEGGLTDGEPMIFAFGNPTRNTGWFYDCFNNMKHRWMTKSVDSRNVQISNKKLIEEWIRDHGEDSDFVRVRVKGVAPSASVNQLIPRALAEMASKRQIHSSQYEWAAKILGVDVAWINGNDKSTIVLRQGNFSKVLGVYFHIDNMALGALVSQFWEQWQVDACFIDVGWGTGVIDYLRLIGREPIPVNFGGKAINPLYKNKRTEMWCDMYKWLQDGGKIDDNTELIDELCAPEIYEMPNGQRMLQPKDDMDVPSPNIADGLCLTHAMPVKPMSPEEKLARRFKGGSEMCRVDDNVLD